MYRTPLILAWYKNFINADLYSTIYHWYWDSDEDAADSVDLVSWSGHNIGNTLGFYKDTYGNVDLLDLRNQEVHLGDTDADWVIFDTCESLKSHSSFETPPNPSAILNALKEYHLNDSQYDPSIRNAHMFLGYKGTAYWNQPGMPQDIGKYFADQMKDYTIKDSWIRYIQETQPTDTTGRIFYAVGCQYDTFAGPGLPGFAGRDPLYTDTWTYLNITPN